MLELGSDDEVDDDDLLSPKESAAKEEIWTEVNKDWLEYWHLKEKAKKKQAERAKARQRAAEQAQQDWLRQQSMQSRERKQPGRHRSGKAPGQTDQRDSDSDELAALGVLGLSSQGPGFARVPSQLRAATVASSSFEVDAARNRAATPRQKPRSRSATPAASRDPNPDDASQARQRPRSRSATPAASRDPDPDSLSPQEQLQAAAEAAETYAAVQAVHEEERRELEREREMRSRTAEVAAEIEDLFA